VAGILGKIKNKLQTLTGRMQQYQKAITFAEAGRHDTASEMVQESIVNKTPRKLVVIGKESTFSKEIIDYAIDMAQQMSYEIVALNTAPLSCDTFKMFSDSRDRLCLDFQMLAEQNVQPFKEKAESLGIPFTHVVKYTDSDEVLAELRKEIGEFEFVISEEEDAAYNRSENEKRPRKEIFVYSVL